MQKLEDRILANTVSKIRHWLCKETASFLSLTALFIVQDIQIWIKELTMLKKNNVAIQSSDCTLIFNEAYAVY